MYMYVYTTGSAWLIPDTVQKSFNGNVGVHYAKKWKQEVPLDLLLTILAQSSKPHCSQQCTGVEIRICLKKSFIGIFLRPK